MKDIQTAVPQPPATQLDAIFAALADPTRRAILAMLLEDDMAVTDVAEPFGISLAAISKHLSVLERAGLIVQEKRGRLKWCKLEPAALKAPSVWMQGFGQYDPKGFWPPKYAKRQGMRRRMIRRRWKTR